MVHRKSRCDSLLGISWETLLLREAIWNPNTKLVWYQLIQCIEFWLQWLAYPIRPGLRRKVTLQFACLNYPLSLDVVLNHRVNRICEVDECTKKNPKNLGPCSSSSLSWTWLPALPMITCRYDCIPPHINLSSWWHHPPSQWLHVVSRQWWLDQMTTWYSCINHTMRHGHDADKHPCWHTTPHDAPPPPRGALHGVRGGEVPWPLGQISSFFSLFSCFGLTDLFFFGWVFPLDALLCPMRNVTWKRSSRSNFIWLDVKERILCSLREWGLQHWVSCYLTARA